MTEILAPISPGELLDKLTILRLKEERIAEPAKLAHVREERAALSDIARDAMPDSPEIRTLWDELYQINAILWQVEDDIRACEARQDFSETFVALARSVYRTNDRRAEIKRRINEALGSTLIEEKSYTDPDGEGAA
ncbi:DUF6165 family protein [Pseudoroseicyclus aestuarii]|uniref:Uncharacterized protein n=1 Tax=Pseudoroseicyclus aestuarii TaxID=1795041 RepID=A0A318SSC0_9RHOB|nr:DUF6165 family protein [Pseudoroseicyclus aestuarii]PYE84603.1 hypothetical protein DFP88_102404 [Pseudoroseicyclus aestuarii]